MHKIIHQIIKYTIPDDISVGYLGVDDDETILKAPICLTTPRTSKPTASVRPIQPTLQCQQMQQDSQITEEENTNPHPQVQPIDVITIPDIQPSPPPQNPIEVITISDDDSMENILTESHSSLTSLTGILAKRKRSNFWLKIEGMKLKYFTKQKFYYIKLEIEIIPPITQTCLFTSFMSPIINITPIIMILQILMPQNQFIRTPILQTSLISHHQLNVPGHYVDLPGKGLCQSHAPNSSIHQKRSLIQLLHQQGKNKML